MMKVSATSLKGLYLIETNLINDERGYFMRLFCRNELGELLGDRIIKQVNHSCTKQAGSIRGMHFQYQPKAEAKFVRCLKGRVFDAAIDLRQGSETFLQWYGCELSVNNRKMLFIPEGFAHGFQTLEENSEMLYLHTEFYSSTHEGGIRYNDNRVEIEWPISVTEVSERDRQHPLLSADFDGIKI
ncbi:MAG: dTDP-4-dehydrorhamnose 3,5-epimerase [Sedimentisphaerales bacterium]|nr:dTDP-4-dehydrorhamnose 3,5-epimerase [Sedimentisphaerales bacterium]